MSDNDFTQADEAVLKHEEYGPGYRRELIEHHNARTAENDARFLLPHLAGRVDILDCGCGKGSITLGIAKAYPAARVVGCDIGEGVVAEAQADALLASLENVTFQIGSIYSLPFDDGSFDAIIAHAVFQHLSKPEAAMAELDRVLRPGGVIGLRDDDRGSMVLAPHTEAMARALEVMDWFMLE
ncbi:MAG: class I SAM-dependent methyltransferase, partial [Paracoccaceae bacterium]